MNSNRERNNSLNLSQELNALINAEPTFVDPEDAFNFDEHSTRVISNSSKTVSKPNEYGISFMKRSRATNLSDLNQKYKGKKVNRSEYFNDNDDENSNNDGSSSGDDDEDDELCGDGSGEDLDTDDISGNETNESEELEFYRENISAPLASIDDDIDDDIDDESNNSFNESEADDIAVEQRKSEKDSENSDIIVNQFSNIDVNDEILKGVAVKNQLIIWDKLLECRIKMQKLLIETNKLPQHDLITELTNGASHEFSDALNDTSKQIKKLFKIFLNIDSVIQTQNDALFSANLLNNDELKTENLLKRKMSSFECNEFLTKRQKKLHPIRDEIIDMWYNKTLFLTANTKRKTFDSLEQSATKQIDHILSDMDRLVKRTQIKRSVYTVIGKSNVDTHVSDNEELAVNELNSNNHNEVDAEIFDDDDFYHQLLREIIENKTSVTDSLTTSRKWVELQRMRNKMKRKIDTKASKGRKVRYDVHSKLVNFMTPINNLTFTEQAKDQLFNSLFGKSV